MSKLDDELESAMESTIWKRLLDEERGPIPHIAHYTSMESAEKILSGGELWLSNPRNMNDWDELWLGVELLRSMARNQFDLNLGGGSATKDAVLGNFLGAIETCLRGFEEHGAPDTYVFCFSEHDPENGDGVLSMWRGYGNGGSGVAIVFDGSQIPEVKDHPLVFLPVTYESTAVREKAILDLLVASTKLAMQWSAPEEIFRIGRNLVDRVIVATLFSKHEGFRDEREWRLVYRPEWDEGAAFEKFFGYCHSHGVMDPKLKLPIGGIPGIQSGLLTMDRLVSKIIVGPVAAKDLVLHAFKRMLKSKDLDAMSARTVSSRIPFRG